MRCNSVMALLVFMGAAGCGVSAANAQFAPAISPPAAPAPPGSGGGFPPLTVPAPPPGWLPAAAGRNGAVEASRAAGGAAGIGAGVANRGVFEWEEVDGEIYARVTPEMYDQLLSTGIDTTEGTVETNPQVQPGGPGAGTLMLGGVEYHLEGSVGTVEDPDRGVVLYVLRFSSPEYGKLLMRIPVPEDEARYGTYSKYGPWSGTSYAGHDNLPPAYWIYNAPNWELYELKTP